MARFLTCGFELNSTTAGHEVMSSTITASGDLTIQSTTKRSGTYALKVALSAGSIREHHWTFPSAVASTGDVFTRVYLYIETAPGAACEIIDTNTLIIRLNTDLTFDVLIGGGGTVASNVSGLTTNTWHRLEIRGNQTADTVTVRIDGTQVVDTSATLSANGTLLRVGGNVTGATSASSGTWYFDDIAVNDASGGNQTSWPGAGSVIYLRPNGEGDADTGTPVRGGTDSGSDFGQMDEVTPNDGTDYMILDVNPCDVWVDVQNGSANGIGASDTITLVEVNGRITGATGGAANWLPRIKKVSGGVIAAATAVGLAIDGGAGNWTTNDDTATSKECKLVRYTDPDGNPWTPSTIDTMQINARTEDGNPDTWVSTLWAIVEFIPAAVTSVPTFPTRFVKKNRVRGESQRLM